MDMMKQILFLESQDTSVSQSAKDSLLYLLNLGSGIPDLVHYYAEARSERVLDLLCRIREPNDKQLLDTLQTTIKDKKMQETLILLGQIVQQNPSWIPKIPQHPIFKSILEYLRNKPAITDIIAGLLFLSLLLPHCCAISNSILMSMFHTFFNCCDVYIRLLDIKKKTPLDTMNVQHLAFGIREYFQSLYGIYPSNFVNYIKGTFSNSKMDDKKRHALESLIRSLINEVRLHPSLLFSSRESEAQKDRFSQKEPHDFLDEVRRVVIGVIPVPMSMTTATDRSNSEPGSPSAIHVSLSSYQYGDESSSSSNFGWNNLDDSAGLINGINTPEGSISGTPLMKRNTISDITPLVVTSEERRRRQSAEVSRFRLGSIGSTIGKVIKRNITERRSMAVAPSVALIEIEQGNEAGRQDEGDFEEAEEAIDDVPPMGSANDHHLRRLYMSSPASSSTIEPETSPSSTKTSRPPTSNEIAIEKREESIRLREAAKKAKAAVEFKRQHPELENMDAIQQRETKELYDFIRSRSTSLMPQQNGGTEEQRVRTYTVDARFYRQENDGEASDSQDGGRSRFSVTSYFNKINRQRFVSECPPVVPDFATLTPLTAKERSLERTMSCPVFVEESGSSRPRLKASQLKVSALPNINSLREQFPYLRLVEPLEPKYLAELENRLASEHDANRDSYMEASKIYHGKLKELGLADRLPGRIYDDMSQITEGLDAEKQRDVLRARLQLVNQHLMYERSCRMLHANRNRRLYAKIKRQELTECELTNARETNYNYDKEVASLRHGLTAKRKELIDLKTLHGRQLAEMGKHNKMLEKELAAKLTEVAKLVSRTKTAEQHYANLTAETDDLRRAADDAVAELQLAHEKIVILESRTEELKRAHAENEILRDQIAFSERANEERLKSPECDEGILQVVLENIAQERDLEKEQKEEMRERIVELETVLKEQQKENKNLQMLLDRSSRLLREQNEAAEQKFFSLQMVSQKQEEFISELFVELESAKDSELDTNDRGLRSSVSIPRAGVSSEILPCGSATSEPSYFIREPTQLREPTPVSLSLDDKPILEDL